MLDLAGDTEMAGPEDYRILSVDAVSAGRNIKFRDARKLPLGWAIHVVFNVNVTTFNVLDNDGNNLQTLAVLNGAQFHLLDNSTSAGTWRVKTFPYGFKAADPMESIWVFGGAVTTASAEYAYYEHATGIWTTTNTIFNFEGCATIRSPINDRIYVAFQTSFIEQSKTTTTGRAHPSGALFNSPLGLQNFLIQSYGIGSGAVEEYSAGPDSWSAMGPFYLSEQRQDYEGVNQGSAGLMYLTGSHEASAGVDCVSHNQATDAYAKLADPPLKHYGQAAFFAAGNDRCVLVGGRRTPDVLSGTDSVQSYSVSANTWRTELRAPAEVIGAGGTKQPETFGKASYGCGTWSQPQATEGFHVEYNILTGTHTHKLPLSIPTGSVRDAVSNAWAAMGT